MLETCVLVFSAPNIDISDSLIEGLIVNPPLRILLLYNLSVL